MILFSLFFTSKYWEKNPTDQLLILRFLFSQPNRFEVAFELPLGFQTERQIAAIAKKEREKERENQGIGAVPTTKRVAEILRDGIITGVSEVQFLIELFLMVISTM